MLDSTYSSTGVLVWVNRRIFSLSWGAIVALTALRSNLERNFIVSAILDKSMRQRFCLPPVEMEI
ncbi:MAG: hypothetical protein WBM86_19230 [Waterburya sp.]